MTNACCSRLCIHCQQVADTLSYTAEQTKKWVFFHLQTFCAQVNSLLIIHTVYTS